MSDDIHVVVGGRQSGKTEKMFQWMLDAPEGEHRICVSAFGHARAMRMLREARERGYDLESWQFVGIDGISQRSWSGVLHGRGGHVVLGIDDAEVAFRFIFGWPVKFLTMTAILDE